MATLGEIVLIQDLKRQGLGVTAIARQTGLDRKTVKKCLDRGLEAPPGRQAQADFAEFKVAFTAEPGVIRKVQLFTMVLGHRRWLWGRFCAGQDLQTVLRCHIAAFEAIGGAPTEIFTTG